MHHFESDYWIIKTIFIVVNFVGIYVMWKSGKNVSHCKSKKESWKCALPIIISYAIFMGLRFGRDIDYNVYYDRYIGIANDFSEFDYEIIFKSICWILGNIRIPYWCFICMCSVLLISSLLHVCINHYREYTHLVCLLFLWEAQSAELFIRYYLAFSFMLYAYSYLKSRYYIRSIVFAALSIGTHIGMALIVVPIVIFFIYDKIILPPAIVLILFIISIFAGDVGALSFLSPYMKMLSVLGDRSESYATQFDDIISGEFGKIGFMSHSKISTIIREILQYGIPIYFAKRIYEKGLLGNLEINLFYTGVIIYPIFGQVEILNRVADVFKFYSVFVSGAVYYYIILNKDWLKPIMVKLAYFSLFAAIWPVFSGILFRQYWWHMLYIWDAGDWNTIPLQYFWSELD